MQKRSEPGRAEGASRKAARGASRKRSSDEREGHVPGRANRRVRHFRVRLDAPFDSKNAFTDLETNLDGVGKKGLWLVANYYAAKTEYRKRGAADIPAARDSRGWRFLLATADESKTPCDATVDRKTSIVRIRDSARNMREFESAALMGVRASNDGMPERIVGIRVFIIRELKNEAPAPLAFGPGCPQRDWDAAQKESFEGRFRGLGRYG